MKDKIKFGLSPDEIATIKTIIDTWDLKSILESSDDSPMPNNKFNIHLWYEVGRKIHWDPLTASLYYFRWLEQNFYNKNVSDKIWTSVTMELPAPNTIVDVLCPEWSEKPIKAERVMIDGELLWFDPDLDDIGEELDPYVTHWKLSS